MGNLAMIGNDIYFIEPQPEYFRIVRLPPGLEFGDDG